MWDSIEISGQSASEFDNPNSAPVITPDEGGSYAPPNDDNPIPNITFAPSQEVRGGGSSDSGSTDMDGTLQDESSQNGAP